MDKGLHGETHCDTRQLPDEIFRLFVFSFAGEVARAGGRYEGLEMSGAAVDYVEFTENKKLKRSFEHPEIRRQEGEKNQHLISRPFVVPARGQSRPQPGFQKGFMTGSVLV